MEKYKNKIQPTILELVDYVIGTVKKLDSIKFCERMR